jgi:hypothetical protein
MGGNDNLPNIEKKKRTGDDSESRLDDIAVPPNFGGGAERRHIRATIRASDIRALPPRRVARPTGRRSESYRPRRAPGTIVRPRAFAYAAEGLRSRTSRIRLRRMPTLGGIGHGVDIAVRPHVQAAREKRGVVGGGIVESERDHRERSHEAAPTREGIAGGAREDQRDSCLHRGGLDGERGYVPGYEIEGEDELLRAVRMSNGLPDEEISLRERFARRSERVGDEKCIAVYYRVQIATPPRRRRERGDVVLGGNAFQIRNRSEGECFER